METDQNLLQDDLLIDNVAQMHLKETAMWAKFLAIAGFIASGILALVAVFAGTIFGKLSRGLSGRGEAVMAGGMFMIFYLIIAAIVFFMSLYLYRFGGKMQIALKTNDQENLNLSLQNLKIYYRFASILTIIYLVILFLLLIAGMLAAMFSRY